MMKNCIKQEAMYAMKRHYVPIVTIVFLLSIVMSLHSNYDSATESVESFTQTKEWYISEDIDWKEEITKNYSVEMEGDSAASMLTTDNPIAYEADNVKEALYAISPEFSFTFILESLIGLGFFVVMMLAVVVATYDNKNYTIRFKATQYSKTQIYIAKQIVLFSIIVVSGFISVVVSYIGNRIYYNYYIKNITIIEELGESKFSLDSNVIVKIAVVLALMIFVGELGYAFGIVLKNGVVALIAVFAFNICSSYMPVQFRITDSTAKIMQNVFQYYGDVITTPVTSIDSVNNAVTFMVVETISFILISFLIFIKRSAYK